MKLIQSLNEEASTLNPFDMKDTGMPLYNDMIKNPEYFEKRKNKKFEIVRMTPDEYINRVVHGNKGRFSREDIIRSREGERTEEYAEKMKAGEKFPLPMLDYASTYGFSGEKMERFSQEGLHRALAAKKAGVKKIPVMIVTDAEKTD